MENLLYNNNLNIEKFIHMLDDTTECYKFYWIDSILNLLANGKNVIEFDEIINGMIADAWYSITEYHLHLGLKDKNGTIMNSLERAVNKLISVSHINSSATKEEIILEIKKNETRLHDEKYQISKMVPYRLLSSFLDEISGSDKIWDQKQRLILYIELINQKNCLPYTIENAIGLKKKVRISKDWEKMLLDNLVLIKGWIELKKVKYIQDRNPGVPGIIYKLEPKNEKLRKLKNVRELWTGILDRTKVFDIYSNNPINIKDYEIDHFVPWSYIANDEIWNLMPMESSLNSKKSNKLPKWEIYFRKFAENQYFMYQCVQQYELLRRKFYHCHRDNIVSLWANEELYIKGNTKEQFIHILQTNMKPVYDAARIQGYSIWNIF